MGRIEDSAAEEGEVVRPSVLSRFTGWVSVVPLLFFAAEWVVAASWRGFYGYHEDLLGPLGTAFCGPVGNWPCSELYRVMNIVLVVAGLAVVFTAAGLFAQRVSDRAGALLLVAAGLGLTVSGAITQNVSYTGNLTAIMVFMTLGSVGAFLIATSSTTRMTGERRLVAVLASLASLVGYFAYVGGVDIVGPGGVQRLCIYGILVTVITVGTVGLTRTPAASIHEPTEYTR